MRSLTLSTLSRTRISHPATNSCYVHASRFTPLRTPPGHSSDSDLHATYPTRHSAMCTSSRTCCITDSETRTIAHLCISIAIPSLVALSSSASSRRHPVLCIFFVDTLLTLERRPQGPDPFHYTNQGGLGPSVPLQTCWTCKRPAGACRSGEWCPMVRKQHSDRRIYPTGAAASCEALLEPGAIDMTVHVGGRTAQSASVRRAWR